MLADEFPARMYFQVLSFYKASKALGALLDDFGESGPLLKILALEILMKCLFVIEYSKLPNFGHDYSKLFSQLGDETQKTILGKAANRYGKHADLSEPARILGDLSSVFLNGRYSYELRKDHSDAEILEIGKEWMKAGAKPEHADFNYWPSEANALIFAMADQIQYSLGLPQMDVLSDMV